MSITNSYNLQEDDDIVTLLTILNIGEQDIIDESIYKSPNKELEALYEDDVDMSYYTNQLYKALKSVYDNMCTLKTENDRLELANTYLRSQLNAYGISKISTYTKVNQSAVSNSGYFCSSDFINSHLYEDEDDLFTS